MKNDLRTKGRNGSEWCLELDKMADALINKTESPEVVSTLASTANTVLRIQLGHIEHARARGDKPNLPYFKTE